MKRKILLGGLIILSEFGVSSPRASASTSKPTIKSFRPASATLPIEVTIRGSKLAGSTQVTFNGTAARRLLREQRQACRSRMSL
jgi:hypothetical protein